MWLFLNLAAVIVFMIVAKKRGKNKLFRGLLIGTILVMFLPVIILIIGGIFDFVGSSSYIESELTRKEAKALLDEFVDDYPIYENMYGEDGYLRDDTVKVLMKNPEYLKDEYGYVSDTDINVEDDIPKRELTRKEAKALLDEFVDDYPIYEDMYGEDGHLRDDTIDVLMEDSQYLENKYGYISDITTQKGANSSDFLSFLKKAFRFKFSSWVLIPGILAIVVSVLLLFLRMIEGSTALVIGIFGLFVSFIILFIINWVLVLSVVLLLSALAATGLTCGYLLPPAFKELPSLLREYSKPKENI